MKEAERANQTTESTGARAFLLVARVIVGISALGFLALGGFLFWSLHTGDIGWWGVPVGLFVSGGGLWLGWTAVRGKSENVMNIFGEFISSVLAKLF